MAWSGTSEPENVLSETAFLVWSSSSWFPFKEASGLLVRIMLLWFCYVGRLGKRSPKWRWIKARKGKAHENRTKGGQRKVRGPEWRLQVEQTALLAKPNLHRTGPGGGKKHIKGGAKALFFSLSPACVRSFSPSLTLTLSLPLPRVLLYSLLFESLGWHALTLRGWINLLSSK